MNKRFQKLLIICAPLFLLRVCEAVWLIDPFTGYCNAGSWWYHWLIAALVAALAMLAYKMFGGLSAKEPGEFDDGFGLFPFFAVAGLLSGYASGSLMLSVVRQHPLAHFFMSSNQLASLGIASGGFRVSFLCAVFGLLAAVWMLAAAVHCARREKGLYNSVWFSLAPVVFYVLRAVACFASGPINANDTMSVISIASSLILAYFFLMCARFVSLDSSAVVIKKLAVFALIACCVSAAFSLPTVYCRVLAGEYTEALLTLGDAACSLLAARLADTILKNCEVKTDVH